MERFISKKMSFPNVSRGVNSTVSVDPIRGISAKPNSEGIMVVFIRIGLPSVLSG
jgi:hypothetical protein